MFQIGQDFLGAFDGKAVLKPTKGMQGNNVFLIESNADLLEKMNILFEKEYNCTISPFYQAEREYRAVFLEGEVPLVFGKERVNSWKHNLSNGHAKVVTDIDSNLQTRIQQLAIRAAQSIGLRFCTVDIMDTDEGLKVLEINSTVWFSHYLEHLGFDFPLGEEIYQKALICRLNT